MNSATVQAQVCSESDLWVEV